MSSDSGNALIVQAAAFAAGCTLQGEWRSAPKNRSRTGRVAVRRVRRSVRDIYTILGAAYFRRAYRMSYESFWVLHSKLATKINIARLKARRYVPKGGRKGGKYKLPPIRNGRITTSVRLACARTAIKNTAYQYPLLSWMLGIILTMFQGLFVALVAKSRMSCLKKYFTIKFVHYMHVVLYVK